MRFFKNTKFAWQSLWINKTHALLAIVGVLIGTAAVATLISLGSGVRDRVRSEIIKLGANTILVLPGQIFSQDGKPTPFKAAALPSLTLDDAKAIKTHVLTADQVAAMMLINGEVATGSNKYNTVLLGTVPSINAFNLFNLDEGQLFTWQDYSDKTNTVILGKDLKTKLLGDKPALDQEVIINGKQFKIAGVFHWSSTQQFNLDLNNVAMLPVTTLSAISQTDRLSRILVSIENPQLTGETKSAISALLLDRHKNEDFSVISQDDLVRTVDKIFNILTTFLAVLAAISLIVAGVGIMNVMLLLVSDRKREIGIRKAVGATKKDIWWQFFVESLIISVFGAVLGLILAYLAIIIIIVTTNLSFSLSWSAIWISLSLAFLIGLIFGTFPAAMAANEEPSQILRQ